VGHLARIFTAREEERTSCLRAGLDDIVCKIDPQDAMTWQQVKQDSERLLRVWAARENTAGDHELMEQIMGALADYASATADELPTLVIAEKPLVSAPAPVAPPTPTPITTPVSVAPPTPTPITTPAPAPDAPPTPIAAPTPHIIESKDSKDDDTNVVEGEVVESDEEDVEAVDEDEIEGEVATEEDDEAVESVVEPEAEEEAEEEEAEEEEGMEVDKVVIRGRSYWMETSSKKLYAVVGDDDVGDEVGAIVNGKAVFLAPK